MKIIDFYVSVIDNYGDMGFAINLANTLHNKHPNLRIRFFSDDEKLFQKFSQSGFSDWIQYASLEVLCSENPPTPANFIFNFFDYKFPKEYLKNFPYEKTIISFSYFLLHTGLESLHGTTYMLESGYDRVIHFVPSLLSGGGGIIINQKIEEQKHELAMVSKLEARASFLKNILGIIESGVFKKKWVSIFVYKETLSKILPIIKENTSDTVFWICGDVLGVEESSNCRKLPFLSLVDYGIFLSLCDTNVVRGENSLCQAFISGKPVLWDIYKEDNGAHHDKIEDFLVFLQDFIPQDSFEIYAGIFREFNRESIPDTFMEFLKLEKELSPGFEKISEYVLGNCDLVEKLEEIFLKIK